MSNSALAKGGRTSRGSVSVRKESGPRKKENQWEGNIMSFETVENVLNINTDAIMTLAMASILLLIGYAI